MTKFAGVTPIELDLDPIELATVKLMKSMMLAAAGTMNPSEYFETVARAQVTIASSECGNADEFQGYMTGFSRGLGFARLLLCAGIDPGYVVEGLSAVNAKMRAARLAREDAPAPKAPVKKPAKKGGRR